MRNERKPAKGGSRLTSNADSAAKPTVRGRVVLDDDTTCVLIPVEEYERLIALVEAHQMIDKLEDPRAEWADFDEFKLQLAGNKLAEARKGRKLTQTQLAARLGVPQSQISRIERSPDQTTLRTLKRIAKALGVDVKNLVN